MPHPTNRHEKEKAPSIAAKREGNGARTCCYLLRRSIFCSCIALCGMRCGDPVMSIENMPCWVLSLCGRSLTAQPSQPSPLPTTRPTSATSPSPSPLPTPLPSHLPTTQPTSAPSSSPSPLPTPIPSPVPTPSPSPGPSQSPTPLPTPFPSYAPTPLPSSQPSALPTTRPTPAPSPSPSPLPTLLPSPVPTPSPSPGPSPPPTPLPTPTPSATPSSLPSSLPSLLPTPLPSAGPSAVPTPWPTVSPSEAPSSAPTRVPSGAPSPSPSYPTLTPTLPRPTPLTDPPTVSTEPSVLPTPTPTGTPSFAPTSLPSLPPTPMPSSVPSILPTLTPDDGLPVPRISSVKFYDLGAGATVQYDAATNMAGLAGVWGCEHLFNNSLEYLGQEPMCSWSDAATVEVTFGFKATVLPGMKLFLRNHRLQSTWPRARLYAYNQNATIQNAVSPVVPVAIITAPASIGLCDDLVLDSRLTSGSGGRDLVYNWTLLAASSAAASTINVTKLLSAATKSQTSVVIVTRTAFPEQTKLTFRFTVTNFLGQIGATTFTVSKAGLPAPIIYIQGSNPMTTTKSVQLKLQLSAWQPQLCQGVTLSSSTMEFGWNELTGNYLSAGGSFGTINPRTLTIMANTLVPLQTYMFEAIVCMKGDPHINSSATVTVNVAQQALVVAISGGTTRVVGADATLSLDASASYDPDGGTSPWYYAWTCNNVTARPLTE